MKKISKKDLQGLRRQFPVLSKDEMRRYVGGYGNGYDGWGSSWLNYGFGGYDPDGNFHWYSGYTQDEFYNWEGPWYGGWVYGIGYVSPDANIYGNAPFYIYENAPSNGYNYSTWGDYDNSSGYSNGNGSYGGYDGWSNGYNKINFTQSSSQIGYGVINAMYQYYVNRVRDIRELVDFNSTTWGQGGSTRSQYFYYNGKEVQWTVTNGTAATNYYREVYSLATDDTEESPGYNNYEISILYPDWGAALRLRTSDYETYQALLDAVGHDRYN